MTLPEYDDDTRTEGASPVTPEEAAARLAARRQETWSALAEGIHLVVDAETEESRRTQIFAATEKVALALGQARFYLGERIYEQFLAISWPEFDPGDASPSRSAIEECQAAMRLPRRMCVMMEKYNAWIRERFVPFSQERYAKIEEASKYYDSIVYLSVPTWEIAAASRVGDMFYQFWQDMYRAPIPPVFERTEFLDVADAYRAALDEGAEPLKQNAFDAFRYCLATATREQWFNEYLDRCSEALLELDPSRFRLVEESYAQPVFDRPTLAVPDLDLTLLLHENIDGVPCWVRGASDGVGGLDPTGRYRFYGGRDGMATWESGTEVHDARW